MENLINHPFFRQDGVTKTSIKKIANECIQQNSTSIEALAKAKILEEIAKEIRERTMTPAVKETLDQSSIYGIDYKVKESGVIYDYSSTTEWNALKSREDAISTQRKNLEQRLKLLKSPERVYNKSTGGLVVRNPPTKKCKKIIEFRIPNS